MAPSIVAENVNFFFDIGDHFVVVLGMFLFFILIIYFNMKEDLQNIKNITKFIITYNDGGRAKRPLHLIHDNWHLLEGEQIVMELNNLGQFIKKKKRLKGSKFRKPNREK